MSGLETVGMEMIHLNVPVPSEVSAYSESGDDSEFGEAVLLDIVPSYPIAGVNLTSVSRRFSA